MVAFLIARDDHAHNDLACGRVITLRDVEHYRAYLRAELAKLRNVGDADAFLAKSGCDPSRFGLNPSTAWITRAFNSQNRVDTFVAGLTSEQLVAFTRCCAKWRENGIDDQLRRARRAEYINAPMTKILVARAERGLWEAFERDGWRLTEIARDPAVLGAEPYRAFSPGQEIAFRVCLARAEGDGHVQDDDTTPSRCDRSGSVSRLSLDWDGVDSVHPGTPLH